MIDHKIGTREEWLAARLELLKAEKELTRRSEEVARRRQKLPWALEDGVVYHTHSTYASGLDGLWDMYQWLDRAPKGRNEEFGGNWWRHHDEYDKR